MAHSISLPFILREAQGNELKLTFAFHSIVLRDISQERDVQSWARTQQNAVAVNKEVSGVGVLNLIQSHM